jgi:Ca2+/Na+ antiporter
VDYLSTSGIAFVTIILGLIAFFVIRQIKWDFEKLLLGVWLTVAFLLMESYLFRPVIWVDRYAQFLDIAVLLLAGCLFSLFVAKLNTLEKLKSPYAGYLLLFLLLLPLYGAIHVDTLYGKWGYPSDIAALDYMKGLPAGSLVVAPRSVQSFWVSALSGVNVLGGESSQMVGDHYFGDNDSTIIINSPNVSRKMDLIRKYGVNYIFIPNHVPVYMMWNAELNKTGTDAFNNPEYFEVEKYFTDNYGSTALIKVRENLTPRYNVQKTDWGVTVIGYLISGITLIGCVYLCMAKKFPGVTGKKEV